MVRSSSIREPPHGLKAPRKNFYQCDFSSSGTRWGGFRVDRLSVPAAYALSYDMAEPIVGLQLSRSETRWRAGGRYFEQVWRPGTTVFQRDNFLIDDCTTTGWDHIVVTLEAEIISRLLGEDASPRPDLLEHVVSCDRQVAGILTAMEAEAQAGSPGGEMLGQSLSLALLTHVQDRYSRRGSTRRAQGRLSPRHVHQVRCYVRANLGRNLSLPELASLLQLSPAYFCKAFAKTTGITPHRFIINERIAVAKERLGSVVEAPSDLWSELGFASRTHFSSVFRQLAGCTPSDFKRSSK